MFLYPWNLMIKPLLMIHRGSPTAWLKIKNSETYNLYMHLMYILRIPFTILVGKKALYWAILAGIKGGDFLLGLLFNFVKLPPHLRSDRLTAFTFPLYKEALSLMGTLSFLRVLFISGSKEPHPRSLNYQLGQGTIEISDEARKPRPAEGSASLTSSKSLWKHTSSGYFFHHPQRKLTRSASLTNTIQHGEAMNASSASSFFSESTRLNTNKTINPPNLHRPKGNLVDDLPSESKDPSLANHSDSQDITAHAIPGDNVSQIKQPSKFTKFAKPAAKGNFPTDQTVRTYQIRETGSKATTSY